MLPVQFLGLTTFEESRGLGESSESFTQCLQAIQDKGNQANSCIKSRGTNAWLPTIVAAGSGDDGSGILKEDCLRHLTRIRRNNQTNSSKVPWVTPLRCRIKHVFRLTKRTRTITNPMSKSVLSPTPMFKPTAVLLRLPTGEI